VTQTLTGTTGPRTGRRAGASIGLYLLLVVAGLVVVTPSLLALPDPELTTRISLGLTTLALGAAGLVLLPRSRLRVATVLPALVMGASFCAGSALTLDRLASGPRMNEQLTGPFAEEIVLLIGAVSALLVARNRLHGPLDGLVIGFGVGTGLAVMQVVLSAAEPPEAASVGVVVLWQLLSGLATQAVPGAVLGATAAYVLVSRGRRWDVVIAGLAAPLVLHLGWEASLLVLSGRRAVPVVLLRFAVGIALLLITRRVATRFETQEAAAVRPAVRG
jgi:RsiW-degrading membrane proteinase PrsW (M82 family)